MRSEGDLKNLSPDRLRMKILFVHERLGAFGGAEANIFLAATELESRGHTLGFLHGPGTGKNESAWEKLFPSRFSFGAAPTESTTAAIRQFNPDIIYAHKISEIDVLETLASSSVPTVRMVHDHDLYCMRSYKYFYPTRKPCTRSLTPFCIFPCGAVIARNQNGASPVRWVSYSKKQQEVALNQRFQKIIVYSDYQRAELLRNGFAPDKVEVQVTVRPPKNSGKQSSFSERNLILFAGQIIRGKGVDVLLKALAQIKTPFECAILGDGSHRKRCEKIASQLNLNDRVRFHGYVAPENLERFYLDASVFVMSSVWPEPFGMAGPEAMHYGLPVVAFDAGAISEWLIDSLNGFLVPWMDHKAMASRIETLLVDKTRARQLGRNAFDFVNTHYRVTDYADRLENIFVRTVAEHQISTTHSVVPRTVSPFVASNFRSHSTWKLPVAPATTRRIAL
jgi:glycosyltransferase involved in cell wall biosynthesis